MQSHFLHWIFLDRTDTAHHFHSTATIASLKVLFVLGGRIVLGGAQFVSSQETNVYVLCTSVLSIVLDCFFLGEVICFFSRIVNSEVRLTVALKSLRISIRGGGFSPVRVQVVSQRVQSVLVASTVRMICAAGDSSVFRETATISL